MDVKDILGKVDHTLLDVTATWDDIKNLCDDAMKYQTASVCIPSAYVREAANYVEGKIAICTVIGFPNGYSTQAVKVFEATDAITNGASEIDMVINVGFLKSGRYEEVYEEIQAIKNACGSKILKVIVETCLLTQEEKVKVCELVTKAGADYIKTSTGFSKAGATKEDVSLFAQNIGQNMKIKAAGGIRSLDDAKAFIELGADRLGTSAIVKIVKGQEVLGY